MHFTMAKSAQDFFSNIIASEGSHGSKEKNKFIQFDVYYCCALIGMTAVQLDDDASDLKAQLVDKYPKVYMESRAHIAGLLVATEAKRLGIDIQSPKLEEIMLQYLSDDSTMLSDEGIQTLNFYSQQGYHLIREFPLEEKPTSREEFLEAFSIAMQLYEKQDSEVN